MQRMKTRQLATNITGIAFWIREFLNNLSFTSKNLRFIQCFRYRYALGNLLGCVFVSSSFDVGELSITSMMNSFARLLMLSWNLSDESLCLT